KRICEVDFLIHHMLRAGRQRNPEKEALVNGAERLNYEGVSGPATGLAICVARCCWLEPIRVPLLGEGVAPREGTNEEHHGILRRKVARPAVGSRPKDVRAAAE